jgi:3-oxoacyl-[acyl-carrier-protein] synthase II
MDHFTRMGLLGAHLALADAGLGVSGLEGLGVILASGYGATATTYALLDSILQDGDTCASPTHFSSSLHNACAANIAIQLGCTGPNLTVSQFDLSVPSALFTARQWLLDGRVERVLFGALDELSDLIGYTWYRQRGLPRQEPMEPLRAHEETAIPGEGAAFLVLSRVAEARPGYCSLEAVATGRGLDRPPSSDLLVLNADGRKELGPRYAAMAQGSRVACATPLYGSLPASPAFDLVAGALMLRSGRAFTSPGGCDFGADVVVAGPLEGSRISCLTLAEEDGYGLVELGGMGR